MAESVLLLRTTGKPGFQLDTEPRKRKSHKSEEIMGIYCCFFLRLIAFTYLYVLSLFSNHKGKLHLPVHLLEKVENPAL